MTESGLIAAGVPATATRTISGVNPDHPTDVYFRCEWVGADGQRMAYVYVVDVACRPRGARLVRGVWSWEHNR